MTKLVLVGEAYDAEGARSGAPFVGRAGDVLNQALSQIGIRRSDCHLTNVINEQPPRNDLSAFTILKSQLPIGYTLPPMMRKGSLRYLAREKLHHIARFRREMNQLKPNIIIAFGSTALWALTSYLDISKHRGFIQKVSFNPKLRTVATFHPSYILHKPEHKILMQADILKAQKFGNNLLPLKERKIYIAENLSDAYRIKDILAKAPIFSFDIECIVKKKIITCIGFSPDAETAYVLPFSKIGYLHLNIVNEILALPAKKIAHNGMFDIFWLERILGTRVVNFQEDTMLRGHAAQPGLPKALGALASIYTNMGAWKHLGYGEKEDA